MIERRAGTRRELWLAGIAAGVLAMSLVLAGAPMLPAALTGFVVGIVLYLSLLFGNARKP